MKENVVYKPVPEQTPEYVPEKKSANNSRYDLPADFPETVTEPVIADAALPPRLTRADFEEAAILARKKSATHSRMTEQKTEFPLVNSEHVETIVVDDALALPRLTPEDFTQEAIEKARARVGKAFDKQGEGKGSVAKAVIAPETGKGEVGSEYPEHWKIERGLRVGDSGAEKGKEVSCPPLKERDKTPLETKRLTREDFPGMGSAKMPELVFKKPVVATPEKKSFFKRLIPGFISRYFTKSSL